MGSKLRSSFAALALGLAASTGARAATDSTPDPANDGEPVTEMVVTADRLETPANQVANSLTVVGDREIRQRQRENAYESLRDVPGLTVVNAGGLAQPTGISIRGAQTQDTLVLIDGVPVNDAMSIGRGYDFSQLASLDIERIEVLRGAQSVLYGSDALAGVINVITRHGQGPLTGSVQAQGGSYATYQLHATARGRRESTEPVPPLGYSLGASWDATDGFPAADEFYGNRLNTGHHRLSSDARLDTEADGKWAASLAAHYAGAGYDLVKHGGPGGSDPNFTGVDREGSARLEVHRPGADFWRPTLALTYSAVAKRFDDAPDAADPGSSHSRFNSDRLRVSWQNDLRWNEGQTTVLGLESTLDRGTAYEESSAFAPSEIQDRSQVDHGAFAEHRFVRGDFFATLGGRVDAYAGFGAEETYRLAPGYRFSRTGTTLKGSLGTGFKLPSLYQLYSVYGDPGLRPERSQTYDFGFAQELPLTGSANAQVAFTYFHSSFDDLIDYEFATNRYRNVARATSRGVEASARYSPGRAWSTGVAYTYTAARDEVAGDRIARFPFHQAAWNLDFHPPFSWADGWTVAVFVRFFGSRPDNDPISFGRVILPSYLVVDLTSRYPITPTLEIFGRVDNVLDRAYEEVAGYGTARRSAYAGLGARF